MSTTVLFYLFMCAINFWCSITANQGDFGLITAGNSIYNISMDTQAIVKFPITGLNFPTGIDYDPTNKKVYWTEYLNNRIGRCDLNGGNQQHNFITNTIQPYGLVIDASGQWLYWTAEATSGDSVLEKAKLDGSQRGVIANLGSALLRHIALETSQNKLYWTDQRNHGIRRINTDGSGLPETVINAASDTRIHGIALDIEAGLVFWCDWGKDAIEMYNLSTAQSSTIYQSSSDISPYALALYEQDIYWVDDKLALLQRIPRTGLNQGQIPQSFGTNTESPFISARGLRIVTDVCSNVVCLNGGTCLSQPSGSDLFTCQCTTSYLGRLCETLKSECDTPTLHPNVFLSANQGTTIGATVTFVCTPGYELVGASQATCRQDLTWSSESPTCVRTCSAITPPVNGAISPATGPYLAGHPLTFTCNSGYYLVGLVTILCDDQGDWSSTNYPSCSLIVQTCPALSQLHNGYISGSFEKGSTISFICNEGFGLTGPDRITCLDNLQWSESPPSCVPVCDRPILHENVFISTSFFPAGAMVTFICPSGFTIVGASQATCTSGLTWSVDSPTCARTCSALTPPLNGAISPTTTPYLVGVQVTFTCNTGYRIVGLGTIYCTNSGVWSSTNFPDCSEIVETCDPPDAPQNGNFLPVQQSYNVDQVVTFQCDNGYQLAGLSFSTTCLDDGMWSSSTPICQTITCIPPAQPVNGNVDPGLSSYVYQQQVTFSCDSGYHLVGEESSTCIAINTWSSAVPTCQEITCAGPAQPQNGGVGNQLSTYAFGQVVSFTCNDGYYLVGEPTSTCTGPNTWTPPAPSCEDIRCTAPPQPVNGLITPRLTSYIYQQEVTYSCADGYIIIGVKSIRCIDLNVWSTAFPTCQAITCNPVSFQNGQISPSLASYTYNQEIVFRCNDGYEAIGSSSARCIQPNEWSNSPPTCQEIICTAPTAPVNGFLSPMRSRNPIGTVLSFTCQTGYQLSGVESVTCTESGTWSSPFPRCFQSAPTACTTPPQITNGNISPSVSSYPIGIAITYTCSEGYNLRGTSVLDCTQDGSWSANFPICAQLVMCAPPVTPVDGAIEPASGPFNEGDQVIFRCSHGFQLKGVPAVTCQADGTWTEDSPICSQEFCQQPVVPTNGRVNPTGQIASGSSVIFECDPGYRIEGTTEVICTQLLQWSNPSPLCVEVTCSQPIFVGGNFQPVRDAYALGDEITFNCQSGFSLIGEASTVTCNLQGNNAASWSAAIPSCVDSGTQCPPLTRPAFGIIVPPILTAYPVGVTVTFQCDDGYGIMGNAELICTRDGAWSADIPMCEIETPSCPIPNATSNLIIRPEEGPYDVGIDIRFSCENGFNIKGEDNAICTKDLQWSETIPTCTKSENKPLLSDQDLQIILYAAVPSVGLILLVILCCCCVCCCRKRRRGRADTTEDLIMSYRKENSTFPSGQGTEIYNIYGGRDNRPLAPMRESHHRRAPDTSNNLDYDTNHQYELHYAENPLLSGTLESHRTQSSHQSSNLPAAESTGHYANLDESLPPTMERNDRPSKRRRQEKQPMNQLTRL